MKSKNIAQYRRELILAIRDYIQSLPETERYCNGCSVLRVNRIAGIKGQMICPFSDGVYVCDEHELVWAIHSENAERPLECLLDGEKYYFKDL